MGDEVNSLTMQASHLRQGVEHTQHRRTSIQDLDWWSGKDLNANTSSNPTNQAPKWPTELQFDMLAAN